MLLDRLGTVKYRSGPQPGPQELSIDSPTCQACHALPPHERNASQAIETRAGTVLRTMVPIRNHDGCYRCHDPAQKVNGILVFDLDVSPLRAAMNQDFRWMVAGSGAFIFLLVGGIALLVRVVVVRRLQRVESTARRIASGELEQRVQDEGSDTISYLAREFNTMADSVTGLLGEVRTQRERLETVINSIDDGIVVLDSQRKVVAANDAFLQRTGRYREQVLGCCCTDLGAGMCTMSDCPTMSCLARGDRQVRICQLRDADGNVRWEEVHASPVEERRGRPGAGRRGVAEHHRPPRGRGADGRVAPAGVARHAGVGLLARAEHAAGDRADVRRGDPARRQAAALERARCGPRRGLRRDGARTDPPVPRHHAAFPAPVARPAVAGRSRGPAADGRRGRAPRGTDRARVLGDDCAEARAQQACTSGPTKPNCSTR